MPKTKKKTTKSKLVKKYYPKTHSGAKDPFAWLQLGAAKSENRPVLRYIHSTDTRLVAADGYRLHVLEADWAKDVPDWMLWEGVGRITKKNIQRVVRPLRPSKHRLYRIGVRLNGWSPYRWRDQKMRSRKCQRYNHVKHKHPYRYKTAKRGKPQWFMVEPAPGRYPDFMAIVDSFYIQDYVELEVPVVQLEHAIKQVQIFARDSANSMSFHLYRHEGDTPQLLVWGKSMERGESTVHIKDAVVITDTRQYLNTDMPFNARYVLDALQGWKWNDTVTLRFGESIYHGTDSYMHHMMRIGDDKQFAILMGMTGERDSLGDVGESRRTECWDTPEVLDVCNAIRQLWEFSNDLDNIPIDRRSHILFLRSLWGVTNHLYDLYRGYITHSLLIEATFERLADLYMNWSLQAWIYDLDVQRLYIKDTSRYRPYRTSQ